MRGGFAALAALTLTGPAWADVPVPELPTDAQAPARTPSATLGLDLWFWDNHLPPGEGIGTIHGDHEVVGFEGGSYLLSRQVSSPLAEIEPVVEAPLVRQIGALSFTLQWEEGRLRGTTAGGPQPLPPEADLTPWSEEPARAAVRLLTDDPQVLGALVSTDALAPLPVPVYRVEGAWRVPPFEADLPLEVLPLPPGQRVRYRGEEAQVRSVTDDTVVLEIQTRAAPGLRLANPNDRVVPGWVGLLGLGFGGLLVGWIRRRR